MTKLPRNVKGRELIKALKRLGFVVVSSRGSHRRLSQPDGRWTQVAIHPKPIPQGTLRAILKQADISIEDLLEILK